MQYTKLIKFVLCWAYSPELSLESSGYTQGHHIEHNCFSLLPSVSIADSFLVSSMNKCSLLISVLGVHRAWISAWTSAEVCASLYVLKTYCSWKVLLPWSQTSPPDLSFFNPPFPHRFMDIRSRELMKACHLWLSAPVSQSLHSARLWITVLIPISWKNKFS